MVAGYGAGYGEQRLESANGYVCDKGVRAAYRIPCTLNLVGMSGCIGQSSAFRQNVSEDGLSNLTRQSETYGAHATADIVGVRIADVQCGRITNEEKYESISSKPSGDVGTVSHSSAFTGAGVCLAAGLTKTLEASSTIGFGRNIIIDSTLNDNGVSSSYKSSSYTIDGAIVKADASVGKVVAFGSIDLSTGILTGVHANGGSTNTGSFISNSMQSWQTTRRTNGVSLLGLKLEVPTSVATSSHRVDTLCGLQFYKCSELQESSLFTASATKTQTFLMLVEVESKMADNLVSGRSQSVVIGATPELKSMIGIASAAAIGSYFAAVRKGLSTTEALSASCSTFCSAGKEAALDVGLSCISANLQRSLADSPLHTSDSWKVLAPYVDDSIAAFVRPVANSLLRGNYKLNDFGRDWVKQFTLLQVNRLLRDAGVAPSAIQILSAAYPRIFDQVAAGNPDLLTLLVDLAPVLLEAGLKVSVSGGKYGWVLSYIVVPLMLELFRSPYVQELLGYVIREVKDCATSLVAWIREALKKLKELFVEVGLAGVAVSVACGCAVGSAAAASASVALAPAATVAGSETLGSVAVSMGYMVQTVA
jgi:hypothetical protein